MSRNNAVGTATRYGLLIDFQNGIKNNISNDLPSFSGKKWDPEEELLLLIGSGVTQPPITGSSGLLS
jgi:hypothetical protein